MPPRPTALSAWLTTPVEDSTQLQAMPAATSGTTCGRKRTARATLLIRREATRRMTVAATSAQHDRDAAEEDDQLEGVPEHAEQLVVGEDGLEVVETRPSVPAARRPTGRAST